jgi:GTPase SAR1 family protein
VFFLYVLIFSYFYLREQILRVKNTEDIPLILVGNKSDLAINRQIRQEEGQGKADKWGKVYIETSAKTRENVDKAFFDLMLEIKKRKMADMNKIQVDKKNKKVKKGKCIVL